MGSNFKHETSVLSKPFNVSFITSVYKDRSIILGTTPMFVIKQIPLLKGLITIWIIIEVVKNLSEVVCLIKLVAFRCQRKVDIFWLNKGRRRESWWDFGKGKRRKTHKEERKLEEK